MLLLFESESISLSVVSDSLQPHGLYVARQAPLAMKFSRRDYWSRLSLPSPGDLPDSRIEPGSSALQADSLQSKPGGKPLILCFMVYRQ